ncbi:MAG: hypothetical protein ACPL7R_09580, partial [Anaerolineae bacterium]
PESAPHLAKQSLCERGIASLRSQGRTVMFAQQKMEPNRDRRLALEEERAGCICIQWMSLV